MDEITLDIAPEALDAWRQDPITLMVMEFIAKIRASAQDALLDMPTRSYSAERIALELTRVQGYDDGLNALLTLKGEIQA